MQAINNPTLHTILDRRSVKSYTDRQVPKDQLELIIQAGLFAPSGMDKQAPIFLAVQDKSLRDELSALNAKILGVDSDPFYNAPTVIAVLADKSASTYIEDASLALGNMMNAACSMGISSCWIHRAKQVFELPQGKKILEDAGISGDYAGVGFCILGYENQPPKARSARLEHRVFYK